jgi:hypothetical protein
MCIMALACINPSQAHHSNSMFDATPVWVTGTVVRYEPVQPHATIVLEQRGDDGQRQQLTVEGPNLNRLGRLKLEEDFLKAGDVIDICGFAFKDEFRARPSSASDAAGATQPALHAQILVLPDGQMQSWGPYGKFVNCVRPDDKAQVWLDFLNTQPIARDAWCNSQALVEMPSTTPQAFVDEVNRRSARPCR